MRTDTLLDSIARFRGQLLNMIGSTSGAPSGPPNMVQKLTPKSRRRIEFVKNCFPTYFSCQGEIVSQIWPETQKEQNY